ncbi:MAG: response regulator transcription factor [Solirubrobacteraceae bacterium]|nr:response regulator transcription factor [Solirubrobacteraceae bacterium]
MGDRAVTTAPSPATVLVVDDEPNVRAAVERALRLEGHEVQVAADGQAALDLLAETRFDLILLDVAMPRVDGLEACRRLRAAGDQSPVLMLTARSEVEDRVAGLDAGADDYLVKPFALAELRARVRALLRRQIGAVPNEAVASGSAEDFGHEVLRFADLRVDLTSLDVFRGDRRLQVTRTELELLRFFLEHPRQVLSRTQLFEGVWGFDFGASSNSLGVYVGYLRRKLESGGEPRLLWTVRGLGYMLRETP